MYPLVPKPIGTNESIGTTQEHQIFKVDFRNRPESSLARIGVSIPATAEIFSQYYAMIFYRKYGTMKIFGRLKNNHVTPFVFPFFPMISTPTEIPERQMLAPAKKGHPSPAKNPIPVGY